MKTEPCTSAADGTSDSSSERSHEVVRAGQLSTEPSLQVPLALQPGHVLAGGRLRLLRLLGRGGSGVVFEAIDAERGERVALKMLAHADPESIYHLKNEFRSIADVRHSNLARFHELLHHEGTWFLVMECVDGVAFDVWVRPDGVLDELRLRAALAQLTAAVHALHSQGKLHRDLKPSNVLVARDGRVVVLDFGLAIDASTGVGQTVTGEVGGTPMYMAPEHALGAPAAASSDLYAIGVMLYEALAGQLPFTGTIEQIFSAKQRGLASWPVVAHDPPPDLKRLCEQLLAAAPQSRPPLIDVVAQLQLAAGGTVAAPAWRDSLPVIVGRGTELETLHEAFRECLAERAALVAVRGTSGIGKTALCESFLGSLNESAQITVLRARCYEHENLPFKALDPLIDALGRQLRRLPPSEAGAVLPREVYALTRLFPSLGRIDLIANMPEKSIGDPQELRRRAFGALVEWLTRIRDRQPVVVFIDDLQWACADSLQALGQMLVERAAPPILIVLAFRDDGAHADMAVSPVMDTARDNPSWSVRELQLSTLSDVASGELAARLFDGASAQLDPSVAVAISREAGGNPLLVRELARFASRGGSLNQTVSLASVLASHLSELTPAGRDLVETVALVGEPLGLELALASSGATLLDVEQLRGARLVRTGNSHKRGGQTHIECLICAVALPSNGSRPVTRNKGSHNCAWSAASSASRCQAARTRRSPRLCGNICASSSLASIRA